MKEAPAVKPSLGSTDQVKAIRNVAGGGAVIGRVNASQVFGVGEM